MTGRRAAIIGGALLALGVGGIFAGHAFFGQGFSGFRGPEWPQNMTSGNSFGGMMGSGLADSRSTQLITPAQLTAWVRAGERTATINRKTDTVVYRGGTVMLVALASPHGQPNMTWEIDGLVNPTVVVPPHTQVTVELVNTDWGYRHGFDVTRTPPPYPYMPMMGVTNQFVLMPLAERTTKNLASAQYYTRRGSFTAKDGTYYYLCPVPGHAAHGMYGRIIVK